MFCFILFLTSLLGSQLIFLLLVFSSSYAHGRLYRETISANGAKEITNQDNSFSKFLGPKEAVNDAFEELSERGDMDKGKRRDAQAVLFDIDMTRGNCGPAERKKICKSASGCYCLPLLKCDRCICDGLDH